MYPAMNHKRLALSGALVLGTIGFVPSAPLAADPILWSNLSGGVWSDPLNWDPNNVPDNTSEIAVFPSNGGTFTTTLDTGVTLAGLDLLNADATLVLSRDLSVPGGPTIENAGLMQSGAGMSFSGNFHNGDTGRFEVTPSHPVYIYGPVVTNDGTIRINPDGSSTNTYLYVSAYDLLFQGTGELVLATAGTTADADLAPWYGSFDNGPDHTIRGEGQISCGFDNFGTVMADVAGRELLLLNAAKSNDGTIGATGDGTLRMTGISLSQTPNGRLLADGGTVALDGSAWVSGGRFESALGSRVKTVGAANVTGITNLGDFEIGAGTGCYLYGPSVTNDGTIEINRDGSTSNTVLYVASYDLDLSGTGEIVMKTAGTPDDARIDPWYGSLVNGPLHTIRGSGRISAGVANNGTIRADDSEVLTLSSTPKSNQGSMESYGPGTLEISGTSVTQSGSGRIAALAGGTTQLTASATITGGSLENAGGTLESTGTTSIYDPTFTGVYGIRGGVAVYLYGNTRNDGTIVVNSNSSSSNAHLYVSSNNARLDGTGDVELVAPTDLDDARIDPWYGTLVQGPDHTIHGTGRLTSTFTNEGTVDADQADKVLVLQSAAMINKGLITATNDGILRVESADLTEDGGRFLADGGVVNLNSCTIRSATFETDNGGRTTTTGGSNVVDITNRGVFEESAGSGLYVYGNTTNDGIWTINAEGTSANTIYYAATAGGRMDGTGELILNAAGSTDDARIVSWYGNLTQGPAHTIRGTGRIVTAFSNEGTVIADRVGKTLLLDSEGKANSGTFRALGGGILQVTTSSSSSGTVEALDGSIVRFTLAPSNYSGGRLTGGTWKASGTGSVRLFGCPVSTLAAHVYLDGPDAQFVTNDAGASALAGLHSIERGGLLSIQGGHDLTLPGDLVSEGDLVVGPNTTLTLSGKFRHTPESPRACRSVIDGVLVPADSALVDGGWIQGNGRIVADVLNTARANPGNPIGTFAVEGDYEQTATGELHVDLAGTAEGEYDRLAVTGEARLSGSLFIDSTDDFDVHDGDSFVVVTYANHVGEFDEVFACPAPAVCMEVVYESDRVIVTAHDIAPAGVEDQDQGPDSQAPTSLRLESRMGPSGASTIRLELPADARASVDVFDGSGRRIDLVHEGDLSAGVHEFPWTGRSDARIASGMYFVRARVESREGTRVLSTRALVVR
ncbi:MAG: hypothetical protein R3E97_00925 [Candidatus Eisenbacteria bacterium]